MAKEELDNAVPFHILLDVSAHRSRAKLAHKGLLTTRHRPSEESLRGGTRRNSNSSNTKVNYIPIVHKKFFALLISVYFDNFL